MTTRLTGGHDFDTLKNVRVQEKCKGSKGKYQRIKVTVQGDV